VRAGKVLGLAVTSPERVAAFKDAAAFTELGLRDIGGVALVLAGGARQPAGRHRRQAQRRGSGASSNCRRRQKRFENDALVTMDVDAATLTAVIAKEAATWGALAKDIGLRVQ
jgi:tripartite-type tricarboxylate transporter receptor subunit TctC